MASKTLHTIASLEKHLRKLIFDSSRFHFWSNFLTYFVLFSKTLFTKIRTFECEEFKQQEKDDTLFQKRERKKERKKKNVCDIETETMT